MRTLTMAATAALLVFSATCALAQSSAAPNTGKTPSSTKGYEPSGGGEPLIKPGTKPNDPTGGIPGVSPLPGAQGGNAGSGSGNSSVPSNQAPTR